MSWWASRASGRRRAGASSPWRHVRKRDQFDARLDAELRFHLDRLVDEFLHAGLPAAEARRRARLAFGGLDQVKERCRDAQGTRWINDAVQDLRFGTRLLGKHGSFTLVATSVLALGIGVAGLFVTLVEMICVRGLPLERVDRIMYLATRDAEGRTGGVSYPDFEDLRDGTRSFQELAAFAAAPIVIGDEDRAPDRLSGAFLTWNAFRLAGSGVG